MKAGRQPILVGGSIRRQAIRMVASLCVLVILCGGLIVVAVLGNLSASRNLDMLGQDATMAQDIGADQAADSDALRALELHPGRTDLLSRFTIAQIDLENDLHQLDQRTLPHELRAPRQAIRKAGDDWVIWASSEFASVQAGDGMRSDDSGSAYRLAVAASVADFVYHTRGLSDQARNVASLTNLLVIASTLGGIVIGLGGLILMAWRFFRWNLRPMERLARVAADLAAGRDAEITPVEGTTELLELASALEQWRRSMEGRVAVADATLRMSGQLELGELLVVAAESLSEAVDASSISFNLQSADGTWTTHLYDRPSESLRVMPATPVAAPYRMAASQGHTVHSDLRDERHDPRIRAFAADNQLGPALSIPMISGGQEVGTITFVRRDSRGPFSEADIQLAEFSVAHVAAAIHVVELLADLITANTELAEANQHKSEFLAHMSHELRTPLNSILGFAQLLSDESFGALNQRQGRYVGHIRSSGGHLLALINDVLDLSKVEAGQLDLQTETVAVAPLLNECVGDVRPLADAKELVLESTAAPGLAVRGDRRRLAQVVLNLLSNAIKFTPEGGLVGVEAIERDHAIEITVRDSGIGISDAAQERIFEAFFQVRGGRTRQQEGTGLGLALSRRLVELMGGTLSVASSEGQGSTFTVRMPAGLIEMARPAAAQLKRFA